MDSFIGSQHTPVELLNNVLKAKSLLDFLNIITLQCRGNKLEKGRMNTMANNYIGELEELVLMAILKLGPDAYGAAVHEALEDAGRSLSVGALYTTLSRLEEKGLIGSWMGEPTAERGGRAKKYFKVHATGQRALREAQLPRQRLSTEYGIA